MIHCQFLGDEITNIELRAGASGSVPADTRRIGELH